MSKKPSFLPLSHFIRRQEVLKMYRQFLRGTRQIEEHALRDDLRQQVRISFRNNSQLSDVSTIRNLLKEGKRFKSQLEALGKGGSGSVSLSGIGSSNPSARAGPDRAESWLDCDDDEDVHGRVGVKFPWQK